MASDNVAYNIMGHAFFFEAGDEVMNTFSGNLGVRVLSMLIHKLNIY